MTQVGYECFLAHIIENFRNSMCNKKSIKWDLDFQNSNVFIYKFCTMYIVIEFYYDVIESTETTLQN